MENDDDNLYELRKEDIFININELELHKELDNNSKVNLTALHTECHKDEQEILSSQYEIIENATLKDTKNYDNSTYMKNITVQKLSPSKRIFLRKKYIL
ncbi:hypothetical protein PFDG_05198 [Plasmodium falciparum Dd2]|uniref:Uncharacterized protein n=1 Tax=Plasmodium falciparum (isolate Dd2) TaxID=57267 RepID=A0A0L7M9W3_PLAF4|nr:hypothetical protein PFDG_05198 [Plasmodium falciparum Dd2]